MDRTSNPGPRIFTYLDQGHLCWSQVRCRWTRPGRRTSRCWRCPCWSLRRPFSKISDDDNINGWGGDVAGSILGSSWTSHNSMGTSFKLSNGKLPASKLIKSRKKNFAYFSADFCTNKVSAPGMSRQKCPSGSKSSPKYCPSHSFQLESNCYFLIRGILLT